MAIKEKIILSDDGTELKIKYGKDLDPEDINEIFSTYGKDLKHMTLAFVGLFMGYVIGSYKSEHADNLATCLRVYDGPLISLNLSRCNIDDAGMMKILKAIVENPLLRSQIIELNISNNAIGADTLRYIIENVLPVCLLLEIKELKGQASGAVTGDRGEYNSQNNIEMHPDTAYLVEKITQFRISKRSSTPRPLT